MASDTFASTMENFFAGSLQGQWGDVDPKGLWWAKVSVFTSPDQFSRTMKVGMVAKFEDHYQTIHRCQYSLRSRVGEVWVEVSERDLASVSNQQHLLAFTFQDLLEELRPFMYEYDPRIGQVLAGPGDIRTRCDLFDPTHVPNPYWLDEGDGGPAPGHRKCPLCGEGFIPDDPPMWAGGNLMWTHIRCWTEGLPEIPRTRKTSVAPGVFVF